MPFDSYGPLHFPPALHEAKGCQVLFDVLAETDVSRSLVSVSSVLRLI